jgi:hypothetical protein
MRRAGKREAGSSGLFIRAAVVEWVDRTFPFRRGGVPVTAFRWTGQVAAPGSGYFCLAPALTPRKSDACAAADFFFFRIFFCLSVPSSLREGTVWCAGFACRTALDVRSLARGPAGAR